MVLRGVHSAAASPLDTMRAPRSLLLGTPDESGASPRSLGCLMSPCHSSADHTLMPIATDRTTSNEFMTLTTPQPSIRTRVTSPARTSVSPAWGAQYEGGGDVNSHPAELTRSLTLTCLPRVVSASRSRRSSAPPAASTFPPASSHCPRAGPAGGRRRKNALRHVFRLGSVSVPTAPSGAQGAGPGHRSPQPSARC